MLGTIHLFDRPPHTLEPPPAAALEQCGHHVQHAHHGMQHPQGCGVWSGPWGGVWAAARGLHSTTPTSWRRTAW